MNHDTSMAHGMIELAREKTWPYELVKYLDSESERLIKYSREDKQYDDERIRYGLGGKSGVDFTGPSRDVLERINREIQGILDPYDLVGWHCTRLTAREILDVESEGLLPASPELFSRRIRAAVEGGYLDSDSARLLLDEHRGAEPSRLSKLWFVFDRITLADDSAIGFFFRQWGGEATYRTRPGEAELANTLRGIGVPCIVESRVPICQLNLRSSLNNRFIGCYLRLKNEHWAHEVMHEDYMEAPLETSRIVSVIGHGSPDFEKLTTASGWNPPLQGAQTQVSI